MSPQRTELWDTAKRSFARPDGGARDATRIAEQFRPGTKPDGTPGTMVRPIEDKAVVHVLRKIVRGLAHHYDPTQVIASNRRVNVFYVGPVAEVKKSHLASLTMVQVYHFDDVVTANAHIFSPDELYGDSLHSFWSLTFLNGVRVYAWVERGRKDRGVRDRT